jgi:oligopeptide/dipeptide ABC transporter ATP-binding protein
MPSTLCAPVLMRKIRPEKSIVTLGPLAPTWSCTGQCCSKGERQRRRIVIARALALNPDFVVCDEPVSALDVSMQAQIVNLLLDLQDRLGLSYLFTTHDRAVVRAVSTRVAVMYAASIVEFAPKAQIYSDPQHPYSHALLDAVPRADPDFVRHPVVAGEVPSLRDPPPGCSFHPRCAYAMDRCRVEVPSLREGPGRRVECHLFST